MISLAKMINVIISQCLMKANDWAHLLNTKRNVLGSAKPCAGWDGLRWSWGDLCTSPYMQLMQRKHFFSLVRANLSPVFSPSPVEIQCSSAACDEIWVIDKFCRSPSVSLCFKWQLEICYRGLDWKRRHALHSGYDIPEFFPDWKVYYHCVWTIFCSLWQLCRRRPTHVSKMDHV